jgi:hypothetical protein
MFIMHTLRHVEQEQENTVVHKRQDARILTFSLTKASPDASHQYSLTFGFQSLFLLQFICALSYRIYMAP